MPTRRTFLQLSALTAAGVAFESHTLPTFASVLAPQQRLAGASFDKFVDPLPSLSGHRPGGTRLTVSAEEFQQQVLPSTFRYPSGFLGTYVWGYKISGEKGWRGASYPGLTIEAERHQPIIVKYANNLPFPAFLQRYLTVDQTIHWANPLGLSMDDPRRMDPYLGPVPFVTHLHGSAGPSEYDGHPDAWFTPMLPDGQAIHGPAYRTLYPTAPNQAVYLYPNAQQPTALWIHDHALGMTRLNIYSGLAALYLLRDRHSFDTGIPEEGGLPAGRYERALILQDRSFDYNGQLLFPDGSIPAVNDDLPPNPEIHPFWIPEFFGDVNVVNGKAWPFLEVEPRRYRFRILNAANSRFYQLSLQESETGGPGPAMWVIGTDGGLLDTPVRIDPEQFLTIPPSVRYDVIVDFAEWKGSVVKLMNAAPAPFPGGDPVDPQTTAQVMQFRVGEHPHWRDESYDPRDMHALRKPIVRLANPALGVLAPGVRPDVRRRLTLVEVETETGPEQVLVNNTKWDGLREPDGGPVPGAVPDGMGDYLTELPRVGSTEVWEVLNLTEDAHPIHVHLLQFQLINRQVFSVDDYRALYDSLFPGGVYIPRYGPPLKYRERIQGAIGGNPDVTPFLTGTIVPPGEEEAGWKDTIIMPPLHVTRIVMRFAPLGIPVGEVHEGENRYPFDPTTGPGYVWHCHMLDHEDNEMMRPYNVRP